MPEPEPTERCAPSQEVTETGIIDHLTHADDQRPWAMDDLIREFGGQLVVEDAIDNLQRVGLLHRHAGIVFASRAALRFAELKW